MKNSNVVTYVENFAIDLSSADLLLCQGVNVENNVLRSLNGYEVLDERKDYSGLAGVNSAAMFAYTGKTLRRYDGEKFKNLITKMPFAGAMTIGGRYDVYRDKVYFAFDDDGVIQYDGALVQPTNRWATLESVIDLAIVNERIVLLTDNGLTLRFGDVNGRVYSEGDTRDIIPMITLPIAVQAIVMLDKNVLYALGTTCYKVTFSADEQDIKLSAIAYGLEEVVQRSVAKIDDKIIFATRGKIYVLRNDKITAVFNELSEALRSFDGCRGNAWRGRYALTIPRNQGRVGFVLDVDGCKCVSVLNKDIVDVDVFNGKDVFVTARGELARSLDGVYGSGVFARSHIDFGTTKRKFLRRLNVATKYDLQITITNERGASTSVTVKGGDKMQTLNIFGNGRAFDLSIQSNGQMEVTALSLTADTYKEEYYGTYSD